VLSVVCRTCKTEKIVSEFYRDNSVRSGIKLDCKGCYSAHSKRREKLFLVRRRELAKIRRKTKLEWYERKKRWTKFVWRPAHAEHLHEYHKRRWLSMTADQRRESWITSNYGMTLDDEKRLLSTQNFQCPACLAPLTRKNIAIDHDHACCPNAKSCGRCVRAVLCKACNIMIGIAKDNAATLRRAADYIDRFTKAAPVENFSESTDTSGLQASLAGPYPCSPFSDTFASFSAAMVPA
jgi:recombination endonuclease VII